MNLKRKLFFGIAAMSIILGSTLVAASCGSSSTSVKDETPIVDAKIERNKSDINTHFLNFSDLLQNQVKWASFNFYFSGDSFNYLNNAIASEDNDTTALRGIYPHLEQTKRIYSYSPAEYTFLDFKNDILKSGDTFQESKFDDFFYYKYYAKIQPVISDSFIDFANRNNKSSVLHHFFDPFKNDSLYNPESFDSRFYRFPTNSSLDSHERVYLKATELVDFITLPNTKITFKDLMDVFSVTRPKYDERNQLRQFRAAANALQEMQWFEDNKFLKDYDINLLANDDLNKIDVTITLNTVYDETKEIKLTLTNVGVSKEFENHLRDVYDILMLSNTPHLLRKSTFIAEADAGAKVLRDFFFSYEGEQTTDPGALTFKKIYRQSSPYYVFSQKDWDYFSKFFGVKPEPPQDITFFVTRNYQSYNKYGFLAIGVLIKKNNTYVNMSMQITDFSISVSNS